MPEDIEVGVIEGNGVSGGRRKGNRERKILSEYLGFSVFGFWKIVGFYLLKHGKLLNV